MTHPKKKPRPKRCVWGWSAAGYLRLSSCGWRTELVSDHWKYCPYCGKKIEVKK